MIQIRSRTDSVLGQVLPARLRETGQNRIGSEPIQITPTRHTRVSPTRTYLQPQSQEGSPS